MRKERNLKDSLTSNYIFILYICNNYKFVYIYILNSYYACKITISYKFIYLYIYIYIYFLLQKNGILCDTFFSYINKKWIFKFEFE